MRILQLTILITAAILGVCRGGFAQDTAPKESVPIQAPAAPAQPIAGEPEKETKLPKGVIHEQEIKDVPTVHANQPCVNYSWAAALEAALASQHADIKQDFWIDKYYGGALCLDEIGSTDSLIKKAEGEYVLDDGRHVELKLEYFAGLPSNSSALILPIMQDEFLIMFVDGKAELLVGAKWDDYLSKRGERLIDLQELHLLDPLLEPEKQKIVIDTSGDDIGKVTGFMKVKVNETHQQYWPK